MEVVVIMGIIFGLIVIPEIIYFVKQTSKAMKEIKDADEMNKRMKNMPVFSKFHVPGPGPAFRVDSKGAIK